MQNNHGGKRENSGRKTMPDEQKRKPIKYYLNEKERHAVDAFVTELKRLVKQSKAV